MTTTASVRHPAKYSQNLRPTIERWLEDVDALAPVLDPFAGVGSADLHPNLICNELEWDWARQCGRFPTTRGDALHLPFRSDSIGAVVTSPAYGNRMADHHEAKDDSRRNTYRHAIGHPLHPANSGQMQWGDSYRAFHLTAWLEVFRVLRPGGMFILNVKDFIRKSQVQPVCEWHLRTVSDVGFQPIAHERVPCPGQRMGANANLRVDYELLYRSVKP